MASLQVSPAAVLNAISVPSVRRSKAASVGLLLIAQIAAMSVWFSSTAVVPEITRTVQLSPFIVAALTSSVQVGFVLGTLMSAYLRLADRLDPRFTFVMASSAAGVLTALLVLLPPAGVITIAVRVLTGMCLAGVYPVGLRIAATWANRDLGLLMGLLVGALTLGSASPHILSALSMGRTDWRVVYLFAGAAAVVAAALATQVGLGPRLPAAFVIRTGGAIREAWRNKPIRLANLGYLGHMWELYAMWAWIGVFFNASFTASHVSRSTTAAAIATFVVVGVGALGAGLGGVLADRYGRTATTIGAMALSASCAATMGWLFGGSTILLVAVGIVWGVSVIADSAQFSASVTELSDTQSVGTMLTLQTSAGFLLTLVSIQLTGFLASTVGWPVAFTVLAIGPVLGCVAMFRLRAHPDGKRLAGGLR